VMAKVTENAPGAAVILSRFRVSTM
jgi:hypothetical protein